MKIKELPPIEVLRELLEYDSETGIITWKVTRSRLAKVGTEAGSVNRKTGYRLIQVCGKNYTASRIAWALHYGADPYPYEVDHINCDRVDNTIANLRLANRSEQLRNQRPKGISKEKHIAKVSNYGWQVMIGKEYHGFRKSLDEAIVLRDSIINSMTIDA
jgi:hypothetical protein